MDTKKKIDFWMNQLSVKNYIELAEKIGVKIGTIYSWTNRNKIPSEWELKMNDMIAKNNSIMVNTNNGHITQHILSPEIKHNNEKIKKLISLLGYANEYFLDQAILKLEEIKRNSEF